MDVILDTNVYIADPYLKGGKFAALFDYLEKTRSRLILPSAVRVEVAEVLRRQMNEARLEAESATRKLARLGVSLPPIDLNLEIDKAMAAWTRDFELATYRYRKALDIKPDITDEAVRRATARVAPCGKGNEIRDALIWLAFVDHLKTQQTAMDAAFITFHTKDFADGIPPALHPELQRDLDNAGVRGRFYSSLDAFLKDHAAPIEHITAQWVRERTNYPEITARMQAELESMDVSFFDPPDDIGYLPTGRFEISNTAVEITDVYVWEYETGEMRLFVTFSATVDAIIECEDMEEIQRVGYSTEMQYVTTETDVYADFLGEVIGAEIRYVSMDEFGRA